MRPGSTPHLIPFFGAGTSFSKCHANFQVPYDPYMSHLFGGEEFNRAVRLFTAGYDMYGPRRNFVYHYYDADKKPRQGDVARHREFFNLSGKKKRNMSSQTTARWRSLLGLQLTSHNPVLSQLAMQDASKFGLGSRRTLEQYEAFSKVNLRQATSEDLCPMLGRLTWQPYAVREDIFYPMGGSCKARTMKDIRANCCTTLDAVRESTHAFLEIDNERLADMIQQSPTYTRPNPLLPIITAAEPCGSGAALSSY